MDIKIQKKDLLKALSPTLSVSEKRNTMPSLNHALFEAKDGTLQVSATDLEIFICSTVNCTTVSPGRIAVPARKLFEIVKGTQDNAPIHLRITDGQKLEVISGKADFKILGLSADLFPHFKASPRGQLTTGKLKTREFIRLLQKTEHCICTEEIRYFMTGIFLEVVREKTPSLRAVATDGHRLALQDIPLSVIGDLDLKKGLILPRKGVSELRRLLESHTEETFEIVCDENLVKTTIGEYQLWIRPIDGEYPDYRRPLPQQLPSKLQASKRELLGALVNMANVVSDKNKGATFEFKRDLISVSTMNPDVGEASDEVEAKYSGTELKTGFNVGFFRDALAELDGDEVIVELGEKLQPAVLKSPENEGYFIVLMPMRI
jgi:DNA polymerase-3 subunit beta